MKYFNNITNLHSLKKLYNKLVKIYHPDNQQTGDNEKFIEIKNEFDILKKSLKISKVIYISLEQGFKGCMIEYKGTKIVIPKGFYKHKPITIGNEQIEIRLKESETQKIFYNQYNNIVPKLILEVSYLDLILKKKTIDVFGELVEIPLNNLNDIILRKRGYYKRNSDKRGDYIIQLIVKHIDFTEADIKIIENMREYYEKI